MGVLPLHPYPHLPQVIHAYTNKHIGDQSPQQPQNHSLLHQSHSLLTKTLAFFTGFQYLAAVTLFWQAREEYASGAHLTHFLAQSRILSHCKAYPLATLLVADRWPRLMPSGEAPHRCPQPPPLCIIRHHILSHPALAT